jgi:GINS complex subunit 4
MDWDDEYDLQAAGGGAAGPSFIDRARYAIPDEDEDEDIIPVLPAATNETPLEQLVRHWTNERHAPDILPAQEELLTNLLDHLRRQVGAVIVQEQTDRNSH